MNTEGIDKIINWYELEYKGDASQFEHLQKAARKLSTGQWGVAKEYGVAIKDYNRFHVLRRMNVVTRTAELMKLQDQNNQKRNKGAAETQAEMENKGVYKSEYEAHSRVEKFKVYSKAIDKVLDRMNQDISTLKKIIHNEKSLSQQPGPVEQENIVRRNANPKY